MIQLQRLAVTCGGTGGHFNPGLSVAQALQRVGGEAVLLLGGKHAEKQMKIAESCGIKAYKICAVPLGKNPVVLLKFIWNTILGFFQAVHILRTFRPQALLSMGSYTSIPPFLAAAVRFLPFFLHDGNARLGKSNLFMSRWARAFAFSFPSVNADRVKCKAVLTGFPLREALLQSKLTKAEAIAIINQRFQTTFSPDKPTLLVFGGSLGAENINRNIALDRNDPNSGELQIIHLPGPGKKAEADACYVGLPNKTLVMESYEDIGVLYAAADFVISRAGGSTVSELALFGKYALLVPYPHAAELHQNDNAAWLASARGAEIVLDSDCTKEFISQTLSRWMKNRDDIVAAGLKNKTLAHPDAAECVLKMIEDNLSE